MITFLDTYIDIIAHIIVSTASGYFLFKAFHGKKKYLPICIILSLVSGLLIDVDHLFDYFIAFGLNFHYNSFMNGDMFLKTRKTYVLFHGFEYVIIMFLCIPFIHKKRNKLFLTILAVSLFLHICTDIVLFGSPIKSYFITYRILTGFTSWDLTPAFHLK